VNRNLSLLVIFLAVCFSTLCAQDRYLELYQYNSDNARLWENNLFYNSPVFANSDINVRWFSLNERRMSFNQESRRFGIDLGFEKRMGKFRHDVLSGYAYIYDSSDLEINLRPYINRTGYYGYGLSFSPIDSIMLDSQARYYFRNEQDRYNRDITFSSDGLYYRFSSRASAANQSFYAVVNAGMENKELDWESFNAKSASTSLTHYGERHHLRADYSFTHREDDLYTLSPYSIRSQYMYSDTQKRATHSINATFRYFPSDWMEITLNEDYSQRKVRMTDNVFKNNADFVNRSSINAVIYPHQSVRLDNLIRYDKSIKNFSYEVNSRHTENRFIGSYGSWQYAPDDSLRWGYEVNLQRITYPDQENRWDNDLLSQSYRLGITHYLNRHIKLRNWLIINTRDDVYIDALLSSNNRRMRSVSMAPECEILLSDQLMFKQEYLIRADYTSYMSKTEGRTGTIYRQLNCNYSIIFDNFPYIARSSDLVWMRLPFRSNYGKALRIEVKFEFQQNEFGSKVEDYYLITSRNLRYTAALNLKHDIHNLYYIVYPQYTWGTWKEYSLLVGCAWRIDQDSIMEFSLNPYGDDLSNLDWQISTAINLRF